MNPITLAPGRLARSSTFSLAWLLATLLGSGLMNHAAEEDPPPRITVAVLAFEDQTGDPQAGHWSPTLRALLAAQLAKVKSIRVLPPGPLEFGLRRLKLKPGQPISGAQAKQIGELIEARRVVWGSYRRNGELWQVGVRVLNVASGEASDELEAEAADWFEIRDRINEQVLKTLGVTPSEEERSSMAWRGTTSSLALEDLSKAYALYLDQKPFSETEEAEHKALKADPHFAQAYAFLAATLATQGKLAAAEEAVRQALRIKSDYSGAYQTLGVVLFLQGQYSEGEKQLREALRLDPDNPETLLRLGEISLTQGKLDQAIAAWNDARVLDPTSAAVCAHLGMSMRSRAIGQTRFSRSKKQNGLIWET